jgi:hypothetical protein
MVWWTHGVGDHGREDRSVRVVPIELPHQNSAHCELYDEDYGVE